MTKRHAIVLTVTAGLFVWFFAAAVFTDSTFAFRDAAHYYYPLLEFNRNEWSAGRVPLWNPHENLGVPLAASATGSVFYPGTLIFALPIDYAWAYKLYVMGHVLLAAGAAFGLARHFGTSVEAAGLAAVSYAFSGNVLYQYCNVVFLVGAAWLPLALLTSDRMLLGRSFRWSAALGIVLAMVTLGGDPQTAYHVGLLATGYAVLLRRRGDFLLGGWRRSRLVLLGTAAILGLILSAIQVIPSIQLTRNSSRSIHPVARSVWELAGRSGHGEREALEAKPEDRTDRHWSDGLLCRRIARGTHHQHVYDFSVGPWRLAEYVWPNIGGRQFPIHRRWMEAIPEEGRVWVPSFYMGLFPFVLAVATIRLGRGEPRLRWLSWSVVLSVAASFGWYGLGWLVSEFAFAAGADPAEPWSVGAPVGGLYWLLTVLLPGYVYFRYPAKWLTVAAVGLSMLAALGWDRAFGVVEGDGADGSATGVPAQGKHRSTTPFGSRLRRAFFWLGVISLSAAVAACCSRPFWHGWLAHVPPDCLFGPLDTTGAANDLLWALLVASAICLIGWWLLQPARRGHGWVQSAALVLVAVDLAAANGWMVVSAPANQWRRTPCVARIIDDEEARSNARQPYRVFRQEIWTPQRFAETGSAGRLAAAVRWDHDTLWPKYNLPAGISLVKVPGTMTLEDYQVLLREARRRREGTVPDPPSLAAVNTKYLILRGDERLLGGEPIGRDRIRSAGLDDVSVWRNRDVFPRAWIVHQVEVLPAIEGADPARIRRRTEAIYWPRGGRRDLRVQAVVEEAVVERAVVEREDGAADTRPWPADDFQTPMPLPDDMGEVPSPEQCRVVRHDPLYVEISAEMAKPGLVVLADQFYPGWQLQVQTDGQPARRVPIVRTNRVMRGAWLPAGNHRLVYRYRPASFFWGLIVSGFGWIGLGAGWLIARNLQPGPR